MATPFYDPKALLAPKASIRSASASTSNTASGSSQPALARSQNTTPVNIQQRWNGNPLYNTNGSQNGAAFAMQSEPSQPFTGTASMVERLHNLQDRSQAPRKRQKVDHKTDDLDDEMRPTQKTKFSSNVSGGGTLGRGLKDEKQAAIQRAGADVVVDLTNEENTEDSTEDDVVVTKSNTTYDQEVCLGRIDNARVTAHQVPAPQMKGLASTQAKYWPAMRVELLRRPGPNTSIIGVRDPCGKDFGTIDVRTASVLARLMDSKAANIRVQARLDMRQRKPFEAPGVQTSDSYTISINVYAPRKMVNGIGKLFSQKTVFFRDPLNPDRGIPIVNPHLPKDFTPNAPVRPQRALRYTASGTISRTQEEIKQDVGRIFDSLKTTTELPEMEQPSSVKTPLLPHQKQALYFMMNREKDEHHDDAAGTKEESSLWQPSLEGRGKIWYNVITGQEVKERPAPSRGGILADVMGLGKTLNCLSLIMATRDEAKKFADEIPEVPQFEEDETESDVKFNSGATLIVCPVSTVSNWEEQIDRHIRNKKSLKIHIFHGGKRTNDAEDLTDYDIVLTTYSTIASDYDKRARNRPNNPLAEINWFRIVLDEAHLIREQGTRQSKATCNLTSQRRWAVTGTPVQNRLDDLGALLKFLKIKPFDQPRNFQQFIITPFKMADTDVIEKLQVLVNSITLRRLKDKLDLPKRFETIERLDMNAAERSFYEFFSRDSQEKVRAMTAGKSKIQGGTMAHVLRAIMRLRLLCAHGQDLLSDDDYDMSKGFSSLNAIDLEEENDETPEKSLRQAFEMYRMIRDATVHNCSKCSKVVAPREITDYDLEDEDEDDTFGYLTPCNQLICPDCMKSFVADFRKGALEDRWGGCPICETYIRDCSWSRLRSKEMEADDQAIREIRANPRLAKHHGRYSGPHTKTRALIESLQQDAAVSAAECPEQPIKSVVFSTWTQHLDLIQIALTDAKIKFVRLDGSMARHLRGEALEKFRADPSVTVFLISLSAGGLGLNLTTASRVYVMEPQFNPAAEAQAIERVHRLGQKREVHIVRYIMRNSFEEKMLVLQEKKKALADMSTSRERMKGSKEALKTKLDELRELFK